MMALGTVNYAQSSFLARTKIANGALSFTLQENDTVEVRRISTGPNIIWAAIGIVLKQGSAGVKSASSWQNKSIDSCVEFYGMFYSGGNSKRR